MQCMVALSLTRVHCVLQLSMSNSSALASTPLLAALMHVCTLHSFVNALSNVFHCTGGLLCYWGKVSELSFLSLICELGGILQLSMLKGIGDRNLCEVEPGKPGCYQTVKTQGIDQVNHC